TPEQEDGQEPEEEHSSSEGEGSTEHLGSRDQGCAPRRAGNRLCQGGVGKQGVHPDADQCQRKQSTQKEMAAVQNGIEAIRIRHAVGGEEVLPGEDDKGQSAQEQELSAQQNAEKAQRYE